MRVVRVIVGTLLVVVALPMLVAGGALWGAMQHRGSDGTFSARIAPLSTDGYAIVAPDLDALLRREASFTRGGQTTLSIAGTGRERLFVGIGPTADVDRYLAAQARAQLNRVRLARGPLPVDVRQIPAGPGPAPAPAPAVAGPAPAAAPGASPLALPATLPFWLAVGQESAGREVLNWSPSSMRDRNISLVVMNASGSAQVTAALTATVNPRWLNPTTWGLLILGTVLFVLGSGSLVWPRRHRDIVYVVEPGKLPEIAARLKIDARGGASTAAAVRAVHGITQAPAEPAPGSPRSTPPVAPWFARVGGSLPHASSVAPTGRQHTHLGTPPSDVDGAATAGRTPVVAGGPAGTGPAASRPRRRKGTGRKRSVRTGGAPAVDVPSPVSGGAPAVDVPSPVSGGAPAVDVPSPVSGGAPAVDAPSPVSGGVTAAVEVAGAADASGGVAGGVDAVGGVGLRDGAGAASSASGAQWAAEVQLGLAGQPAGKIDLETQPAGEPGSGMPPDGETGLAGSADAGPVGVISGAVAGAVATAEAVATADEPAAGIAPREAGSLDGLDGNGPGDTVPAGTAETTDDEWRSQRWAAGDPPPPAVTPPAAVTTIHRQVDADSRPVAEIPAFRTGGGEVPVPRGVASVPSTPDSAVHWPAIALRPAVPESDGSAREALTWPPMRPVAATAVAAATPAAGIPTAGAGRAVRVTLDPPGTRAEEPDRGDDDTIPPGSRSASWWFSPQP